MKVLHVVPTTLYPKELAVGGLRSYMKNMQKHLKDYGVRMDIMAAAVGKYPSEEGVILVETPRKSDVLFSLNAVIPYLKSKGKYDLIQYSSPFLTLPLMLLLTKKPTILTLHGPWSPAVRYKRGLVAGLVALAVEVLSLAISRHILMPDAGTEKYYLERYPWIRKKTTLISMGVDTEEFNLKDRASLRGKYPLGDDEDVILYVGRLEREKNVGLMLDAYHLLRERNPKARLLIVGEGSQRKELEEKARQLPDGIRFMGALDHHLIPEVMNTADVFLLASLYESCPLVAEEALACGIPLVSVDVGRIREFIQKDTGVIVNRDKQEMAASLEKILRQKNSNAVRQACRLKALEFGFRDTVEKTVEVYNDLTKNEK